MQEDLIKETKEKMEKSINLFQDDTNPHNVNPWTKPKGWLFSHYTTQNDLLYQIYQVCPDIITMNSKYISMKSNKLLSYFNGQNKACFDYSDAFNSLPN